MLQFIVYKKMKTYEKLFVYCILTQFERKSIQFVLAFLLLILLHLKYFHKQEVSCIVIFQ